ETFFDFRAQWFMGQRFHLGSVIIRQAVWVPFRTLFDALPKQSDGHLPGRRPGALLSLASRIEVRKHFIEQSRFFGQKACLFSALEVFARFPFFAAQPVAVPEVDPREVYP